MLVRIWKSTDVLYGNSLTVFNVRRSMLVSMQPTATSSTSAAPSFAGLLAALTAPAPRTAWNNDDLADDVATLSYEHALRAHARYQAPDAGTWSSAQGNDAESASAFDANQGDVDAFHEAATPSVTKSPVASTDLKSAVDISTVFDRNKKSASITIRLSTTECEQLRKRAAQAGLTVSAYLRSCTFEAETLRAQVKDVLAELRTAASAEKESPKVGIRNSWFGWLARLMPRWHFTQRVARA